MKDAAQLPKGPALGLLYVTTFILCFHLFFVVYMNSSFLSTLISEEQVGLVYMTSAFFSILVFFLISRVLRKLGNYRTLFLFTALEFFLFLGLAFLKNVDVLVPVFIGYSMVYPILLFNFDVFLESFTKRESVTGAVRGIYQTVMNTALILAPLVAGIILIDENYQKIYLVSALFLVPFIILITRFRNFNDPEYHDIQIWKTFTCIRENKNLYHIFMSQFLMRFFFVWMIIYMPIYLHAYIGFSWSEIGLMTAIILLPYALIEYPAGKLADNKLGEKELLVLGFIITAVFTGMLSFITIKHFVIWTLILFITRIGGSLIDIMTETYFFKHIDGSDNNTISFFRVTAPAAFIIGPLVGTIALSFLAFQYIWIVLGMILLIGILYSLRIQDTR